MKNAKFILLILVGVLLTCNFGCGGVGSGPISNEGDTAFEDEQTDEAVLRLAEKILSPSADGSPMIFDYAPDSLFSDDTAPADPQGLHFVKYISSKDLNSDGEYLTTIHLNKDSEYVIKYSHGGRTLTNSLLSVTVTAPDGKEMVFDLASEDITISEDIWPAEKLTEAEIAAWLIANGMTREEFDEEMEEAYTKIFEAHHAPVIMLEIIPEENPCIILYTFKAPMTGDYVFAVSELVVDSTDISVDRSPDVPFEFRIYNTAEAYSISDGEEIELYPRDILDLQRMLLSIATEFNENGLPVKFEENEESDIETSDFSAADDEESEESGEDEAKPAETRADRDRKAMELQRQMAMKQLEQAKADKEERLRRIYGENWRKIAEAKKQRLAEQNKRILDEKIRKYEEAQRQQYEATHVKIASVINNVPYDEEFALGAGFYAHSGLRATTKVIKNFSTPTGNSIKLKENFSANVIATQEEHDRSQELGAMSNFSLLRNALGYTQRQDYARLGSDHTKIISVRYELIEQQPRTPASNVFKIDDEEMNDFKKKTDYYKEFRNDYGDYFVAGYTWGNRYDAIIEIVIEPDKSRYFDRKEQKYVDDAAEICDKAAQTVQDLLKSVKENAVSERDKGKSNDAAKARIEELSKELRENFFEVTINVSHCTQTGRSGDRAFSIDGFRNSLAGFIKSAKTTPRSQYNRLYVTLRRFREIEALKSYIPEDLEIQRSLYNNIRTLTETIFRTRCYYNALMAIPASHLRSGTSIQSQWRNEFETQLVMEMRGGLTRICDDEKLVADYQTKFNALYEKYKALAERYNFYRYFVHVQKNTTSASWDDSDDDDDRTWEDGFRSYNKSTLIQKDIEAGRFVRYHHKEPCTSGPRGATFSGKFADEYIIWYKTGHTDTNHCTGKDANGKTIGRNYFNWVYTGASSRRCEVFLEIKTIKLSPDLYPFAGLE